MMDGTESSYEQSYDGRMSALPDRVEVRIRPERRRRWSSAAKLAIVRETLAPGSVAQVVADRHGIGTGLIYTWRKQMLRTGMAGFATVEVTPEAAVALPSTGHDALATPMPPPLPAAAQAAVGSSDGMWTARYSSACWRRACIWRHSVGCHVDNTMGERAVNTGHAAILFRPRLSDRRLPAVVAAWSHKKCRRRRCAPS